LREGILSAIRKNRDSVVSSIEDTQDQEKIKKNTNNVNLTSHGETLKSKIKKMSNHDNYE